MKRPSDKSSGVPTGGGRGVERTINLKGTAQKQYEDDQHGAESVKAASSNQGDAAADRENRIRERAYWIWLREGLPDGRQEHHWRQAEKEVDAEDAGARS